MKVLNVNIYKQTNLGTTISARAIVQVEANDLSVHEVASNSNTIFGLNSDLETSFGNSAMARLVKIERADYLKSIKNGVSPFNPEVPPLFNDYLSLLRECITEVLKIEDATDPLLLNGQELLATITDVRLKEILGTDDAKIAEIRASSVSVAKAKAGIVDYHAVTL